MTDRGFVPDEPVQKAPKTLVEAPDESAPKKGDITADTLWQPAFNEVWNATSAYFIGRANRGDMPPSAYDELFCCGGRACVAGDTKIATPSGEVAIKDFGGGTVFAIGEDGRVVTAQACKPVRFAPERLYEVALKSGRRITVTANHRFLSDSGWVRCADLAEGVGLVSLPRGASPSAELLLSGCAPFLRESYDDGHPSASLGDVFHCLRTLLGSIYRYWQDCRPCGGQPRSEADTYLDVLRQLADAQTHIPGDSCGDGLEPDDICTHAFQCGCLRATDCLLRLVEGRCSGASEIQVCEMLSELLSECVQATEQFQRNGIRLGIVEEVSRILLSTMKDDWDCVYEPSSLGGQIRRALYGTLVHRVGDQTFSDSIRLNRDVLKHDRLNCIAVGEVESITFVGEDYFYDLFVPFYNNYIGNGIVNHNSGKSVAVSVFVWLTVENDPLKNAVVIRKVGSSLRKSCWKQMMKTRAKLGLYHWEPNKTDMTFTNRNTGQQIYFVGLDDEEKVRSITVEVGYISIAWFEEAKQFKNMEEIDQAVASLLRGGADSDERDYDEDEQGEQEYMTILTYNPPKSNSEWINQEARKKKRTRLVHRSTYLTMPKAWLGRKILSEIEQMKERNPRQYEHMYLGKVTGTGGEYFDNITIRHITEEEIAKFDYTNMGIDWGKVDPNVWMRTYIDTDNGVGYVISGIYQKEWDHDSPKSKYEQFAEMVVAKTKAEGVFDETIWYDAQGDAPASILAGAPFNLSLSPAPKQGANGRDAGGSYLQSLKLIIINDTVPEEIREELVRFEALPKPDGGWFDKPGKKEDHSFDCFRYSENEAIRYENISYGNSSDSE